MLYEVITHKSKRVEQVDAGLFKGSGAAVPERSLKAVQRLKQTDDIGGAGRDGHGLNRETVVLGELNQGGVELDGVPL